MLYELQCFIVREWNSKKYLSLKTDHDGSNITPKEDIGEVVELEANDDTVGKLRKAQIIGVPQLANY